nr:probable serine carboxypeptidase CPVL [Dermacentor andersoni]
MIDPITMLLYGDFLYDIGLLDRYQASRMQQDCDRIAGLIREENYLEAAALAYSTVLGVVTGYPSYLGNVTGYKYGYNYLLTEKPESHSRYTSFVKTPMVRQAIHVGSTPFNKAALNVAVYFTKDLMHSVRDNLTLLLDNSYKVLIYSGPLDIIVSYPATEALMYSLKWSGSKEWSKAEKKIWRSNDGECVYGYSKHARNCRLVLVRNGGHIVPYDQPEAAYEMITKFFNNVPFVK